MTNATPLHWPAGWPRTQVSARHSTSRFKVLRHYDRPRTEISFAEARDRLFNELDRLGAKGAVISSNHPVDVRGIPIEGRQRVADPGVALYFTFKGKPLVMASDRFDTAAGNMASLRLAIEAMRQLERHGGGAMMERAFDGFIALPQPKRWWEILGIATNASRDQIERAYREKAKAAHPDAGGSTAAMAELNEAKQEALREYAA